MKHRSIALQDGQILLDGTPRILLCASLFPFRLPREQWADRIGDVRRLGYDFIDLIIPWNFHETSPGRFDFEGRRDVEHFLRLVNDAGLLVMARPGPYICAEYDGGGYPAWLGTVEGLRLRQNEPRHLEQVGRWFDVVLPLLARHQLTAGGPVALVQLENELDFSACDDPAGYIAALRAMASKHEISVPLITCAGEGDLFRSNGEVPEVTPAVNLYPDDESTTVEDVTGHYARLLRKAGHPLIITESNRLHRTIRRMIIAGAKFVGPYLQASSWNFDMCTSTNSWGAPYAFMSSDYDFGGVIAPDGSERPDAQEARVLARLIAALGPRLAGGNPTSVTGLEGDVPAFVSARAIDLMGGGRLVGITNLDTVACRVTVEHRRGSTSLNVAAGRCNLLPVDLPLDDLGLPAAILASDAEIVGLMAEGGQVEIVCRTDDRARIEIEVGEEMVVSRTEGLSAEVHAGVATILGQTGVVELGAQGGVSLLVRLVSTQEAAAVTVPVERADRSAAEVQAGIVRASEADENPPHHRQVELGDTPQHLERHGIFRGTGIYRGRARACRAIGVLLDEAADILTVDVPGVSPRMVTNGGQDLFIEFDEPVDIADDAPVAVRAEIWGHSNFHDERLPAMRLGSLRGISGAGLITEVEDLTYGWLLASPEGAAMVGTPSPYGTWAGWSSSARPQHIIYRRQVRRDDNEVIAVRIPGTQGVHQVELDGRLVGLITPLAPVLDLTRALVPGVPTTLAVHAVRHFDEILGRAELLRGVGTHSWSVTGVDVNDLAEGAERSAAASLELRLPVVVRPSKPQWIHVPLITDDLEALAAADLLARFSGEGLQLTVVHRGHVVARIFTEEPDGAQVRGGRGDVALVVREWVESDPHLHVLAKAVGPREGTLKAIRFSHQIDLDPRTT